MVFTPIKFFAIFFFILTYMLVAGLIWLVPFIDSWNKRKLCIHILSYYCRLGLFILRIQVELSGPGLKDNKRAHLLVGNHLSYTDILIVAAHRPTCFVTSMEIRETPFLGQICLVAGCLFVERRNKTNIMAEVREITTALEKGINVVIFPEATSTNGEQILRFRKPLFAAAVGSQTPVLPFCLNYRFLNGEPVDLKNRDFVFWYGDMPFASHLWSLSRLHRVDVDFISLKPLEVSASSEIEHLASQSQRDVEAVFKPVVAPISLSNDAINLT